MKRNLIRGICIVLLIISMPLVFSCDTTQDKDPYIVINVNFSQPVNDVNKLYIVFYYDFAWTTPWLVLSFSTKQLVIPRLNIGSTPLYFEIIYDQDANGIDTGDLFQGWSGVTSMLSPLTPLILPKTDMVMLNFDLDTNAAIP